MTNEELETIKSRLRDIHNGMLVAPKASYTMMGEVIAIIDNVQKRAVAFGRGPDCYNCDCKVKCERYAQR